MCNPIIAVGLTVAASMLGTVASANNQRYQARVADNAARTQRQQAGFLAARQASDTGRMLARQRAALAASGIGNSGSPLDLGFDLGQEGRIAERQKLYEGRIGAAQSEAASRLHRYNAGVDLLTGLTAAGGQLLGTVGGGSKAGGASAKGGKLAG
jgi:hypothetical protein